MRRRTVWASLAVFLGTGIAMTARFFFPRALFEPETRFRIGEPGGFAPGVDERFKQSHRVWIVRTSNRIFAVYARCTHLGCTPNWIESENKFKCPCHGSGYDIEGRNFEGPAPRPMDRARIELAADGQIDVDTSQLAECPRGGTCGFDRKDYYIAL
jgi:cytochrome b6-f complex iron-sulfur subunit